MIKSISKICLAGALATAALTSCGTTSSSNSADLTKAAGSFAYYPKALTPNNPNNVKVKVSTGAQAVYVVEGDRVLLATRAGVGRAESPTPKGNLKVTRKLWNKRRISNPGAGYPMPHQLKPAI